MLWREEESLCDRLGWWGIYSFSFFLLIFLFLRNDTKFDQKLSKIDQQLFYLKIKLKLY